MERGSEGSSSAVDDNQCRAFRSSSIFGRCLTRITVNRTGKSVCNPLKSTYRSAHGHAESQCAQRGCPDLALGRGAAQFDGGALGRSVKRVGIGRNDLEGRGEIALPVHDQQPVENHSVGERNRCAVIQRDRPDLAVDQHSRQSQRDGTRCGCRTDVETVACVTALGCEVGPICHDCETSTVRRCSVNAAAGVDRGCQASGDVGQRVDCYRGSEGRHVITELCL